MATKVMEVVDISANDEDDDEITVLYAKPASFKKGTSKIDAISVEDYRIRKPKTIIDLSQNSSFFDDELQVLYSSPKTKRRVFKGESSNSKSDTSSEFNNIPLDSLCEICTYEKPSSDMFRILGCAHYYCCSCIEKYVASKLQDNVTIINCPVSGCNGFLEPHHCRKILPKQVFDRWGDAVCEAMILPSEKFYCPYKDCSAMMIDDTSSGNEVIVESECPNCNRLFCAMCKVPWHWGINCEEFKKLNKDERSNEDIMLMNLAKSKKWQRCPKCKFYVERSDGCLFMKCRCGYSFCYNCAAPMKEHYCIKCKR